MSNDKNCFCYKLPHCYNPFLWIFRPLKVFSFFSHESAQHGRRKPRGSQRGRHPARDLQGYTEEDPRHQVVQADGGPGQLRSCVERVFLWQASGGVRASSELLQVNVTILDFPHCIKFSIDMFMVDPMGQIPFTSELQRGIIFGPYRHQLSYYFIFIEKRTSRYTAITGLGFPEELTTS